MSYFFKCLGSEVGKAGGLGQLVAAQAGQCDAFLPDVRGAKTPPLTGTIQIRFSPKAEAFFLVDMRR